MSLVTTFSVNDGTSFESDLLKGQERTSANRMNNQISDPPVLESLQYR